MSCCWWLGMICRHFRFSFLINSIYCHSLFMHMGRTGCPSHGIICSFLWSNSQTRETLQFVETALMLKTHTVNLVFACKGLSIQFVILHILSSSWIKCQTKTKKDIFSIFFQNLLRLIWQGRVDFFSFKDTSPKALYFFPPKRYISPKTTFNSSHP